MANFNIGANGGYFIGGRDYSKRSKDIAVKQSCGEHDVTTFQPIDMAQSWIPGLCSGELTWSCFVPEDPTVVAADAAGVLGTDRAPKNFLIFPFDANIGSLAIIGVLNEKSFNIETMPDGVVASTGGGRATGGIDYGTLIVSPYA